MHPRSLVADGDADSNWTTVRQPVIGSQRRLLVGDGARASNSPGPQFASGVQVRSDFVAAGAETKLRSRLHRLTAVQLRLEVGVGLLDSNWVLVQTVSASQKRLDVAVGAAVSNSSAEHVAMGRHTRLDVVVGALCSNSEAAVHTATGLHDRSEVSVGAPSSYCGALSLV